MIKSFKSRALRRLWEKDDASRIQPAHEARIRRMLSMLDSAETPEETNLPGYRFHVLSGRDRHRYSLTVSGNWRLTFGWEGADAVHLDYEDYH